MNLKFLFLAGATIFYSNCRTSKSYAWKSTFRFVNSTDMDVRVQSWFHNTLARDFQISKNNQTEMEEISDGTPINPGLFFSSDSIEMRFENNKKLIYSWYRKTPTTKYIGNDLGYASEELPEHQMLFTYLITQEHADSE